MRRSLCCSSCRGWIAARFASIRYKGWLSKLWLVIFAVSFVILGYYGAQAPSPLGTTLSRVCTVLYFAFFILMPFYTRMEKTKPVPERVTG